ncbi:hypothetical protein DK128_13690 [Vibrio cholerae O1 biovar El Tor]|nr:hypothetical protein [Vibrio cholerae O1 biovar El Tor]
MGENEREIGQINQKNKADSVQNKACSTQRAPFALPLFDFGEGVVPYPPREWPFPLRRMHGESTPIERGSAYAEPLLSVENRYV